MGTPEMITELTAGRIDFFVGPIGIVLPQVQGGQLRTLAANSPKRAAALRNVPTMSEAGLVDGEYPNWFGVFLPVKTSRHIVNGLYDETLKALREPNVKSTLAALGGDPLVMTPTEFDEHVKAEIAIDAMLVKIAGIKPNYASRRFMCKKQQIKARKLKLSAERTVYRHLMLRENIGSFAEAKIKERSSPRRAGDHWRLNPALPEVSI